MADRSVRLTLTVGVAVSLFVCYEIATLSLVLGTPAGGWHYGYLENPSIRPVGCRTPRRRCGCRARVLPSASAKLDPTGSSFSPGSWLATGLHGLLRSLTPFHLEEIFRSDAANSFYSVTLQFEARHILEDFERIRGQWPLHAQSNMPGKLMLLYALEAITPRTDLLPRLIVLVSNLGAFPMYVFVRDVFGDRRVAIYSAALYLFVPGQCCSSRS